MRISWVLAGVIFMGMLYVLVNLEPEPPVYQVVKVSDNVKVEHLEKRIDELQRSLKAYEDKVDDLSAAFIRHHGNYPRKVRK